MLVILEHILTGERFGQYSNHLSPQDRQAAKSLLENQRSVLRTRVQNHLDAAYGLDAITQGSLDTTHELEQHEQFVSLDDGFDPQPPVAANLGGAMNHLLSQALMSEFPGAPNFEAEVKIGNLRKVQAVLSEAAQSQDGRVAVEKTIRSLVRHIANPLMLGEMGHDATHFVLGHHWRNHFNKKAAEASSTISVGQLRKWIDQPRAMGLPKEAQNLVILTYAEQTNRTFVLHNAPVEVSLTNLSDNYVLQEQKLPDEAHWSVAVNRAAQIFGDPVRELSEAYAKLFDKVTTAREVDSLRFAELLRDWTAAKSTDETIVPVEQVLERVVAPIAAAKPVLVVVIDGMSVAVFRELMADVLGHDWVLLAEEGVGLRPALATVPSVTEVSRTSLLTGKLAQGHAPNEKVGFAEHPALLKTCRSGFPPVLFHKASLQETDDSSLAADIRKEIGSAHRKIVGVVVNAVDDHLLKGEQIDTRWSRDEIKVLPVLLHEAKMAGRTVILLSDHGHILDCNAKGKQYEGGERWRFDETNVSEGELKVSGVRVVIPETRKLIAPWTEKIRYGIKKNGYHGGVSPQEMVIPIAVLNSSNAFPAGWSEAPVDTPLWWDIATSPTNAEPETVLKLKPAEPKPVPSGMLFNVDELVQQAEDAAPVVVIPDSIGPPPKAQAEWINRLLLSHVYEEQKRLGGRSVPADAVITRLLQAIDERGGKITSAALARAIQMPPLRLRGLLAIAQRVFNVDGYEVLSRDDVSDTIQLDRALLLKQFDLVE